MPIVNIYYSDELLANRAVDLSPKIKLFFAKILSCNDIDLNSNEITVRIIEAKDQTIAPLEVEIFAHYFSERVDNQDKICLDLREFLLEQIPEANDIRVWLILSELGHSWD